MSDLPDMPFYVVAPVLEVHGTRHEAAGRAAVLNRETAGEAFFAEPVDTAAKRAAVYFVKQLDDAT